MLMLHVTCLIPIVKPIPKQNTGSLLLILNYSDVRSSTKLSEDMLKSEPIHSITLHAYNVNALSNDPPGSRHVIGARRRDPHTGAVYSDPDYSARSA